jgi:signal transduction histidine kinase
MTAAQSSHEPLTPVREIPEDKSATRHRAAARSAGQVRSPLRRQLTVLAVAPMAAAALLGVLAAAVLIHGAGVPNPLHGRTLAAICVLGALLVLVAVAGIVRARTVARSGYPAAAVSDRGAAISRPVVGSAAVAVEAAVGDSGVFVHLSQRLQSLVHRQIELLDALENDVEDPDLLKGLFSVDHLATRMRRHAENLAVLGGAVPRRQWTRPISLMEVLRSAVSETLDYARVQVIARAPDSVNGYAVADVVHLLAELVENATAFSPPGTKVVLRTYPVTNGMAVEIDDRGLGMNQSEYDRLNTLLREPVGISLQELLEGARIGLYVVARLARRHGIAIQLQANITGGTQALVVLPKALLAAEPRALEPSRPQRAPAPAPAAPADPVRPDATTVAESSVSAPADTLQMGRLAYSAAGTLPAPRRSSDRNLAPAMPAGGAPDPGGARPPLPRRRPQEHLAAPLLDIAQDPASRVGTEPSPNLMADFRRGLARGTAAPEYGATPTDHVVTQEGER